MGFIGGAALKNYRRDVATWQTMTGAHNFDPAGTIFADDGNRLQGSGDLEAIPDAPSTDRYTDRLADNEFVKSGSKISGNQIVPRSTNDADKCCHRYNGRKPKGEKRSSILKEPDVDSVNEKKE
ncbi:hypothetical protein UVI_02027440 [Ustilaginoidea virens]|uniref:Uncharacterized protein n=1 Tax=Ustilaginoidea virens TaxID=1159556 RepID=A0A1B5KVJ9_USTVR|nr:hypothetical protein UVI_02027440 [Ustilaginoidea virens]